MVLPQGSLLLFNQEIQTSTGDLGQFFPLLPSSSFQQNPSIPLFLNARISLICFSNSLSPHPLSPRFTLNHSRLFAGIPLPGCLGFHPSQSARGFFLQFLGCPSHLSLNNFILGGVTQSWSSAKLLFSHLPVLVSMHMIRLCRLIGRWNGIRPGENSLNPWNPGEPALPACPHTQPDTERPNPKVLSLHHRGRSNVNDHLRAGTAATAPEQSSF